MISLDLTQTSSSQTASQIVTNDAKPVLSFSDLLRGISQPVILSLNNEHVVVQADTALSTPSTTTSTTTNTNKGVDLATLLTRTTSKESSEPRTTKEALATLLTGTTLKESSSEESDLLVLNEALTTNLSSKDLKVLINEAKEYLKSKITELTAMDGVKESELPKTLKGLVNLAKDLKLDISKISFEDVKSTVSLEKKPTESLKTMQEKPLSVPNTTQEKPLGVPNATQEKPLGVPNAMQEKPLSVPNTMQEKPLSVPNTTQEKPLGVPNAMQEKPLSVPNTTQEKPLGVPNAMQEKPLSVPNTTQETTKPLSNESIKKEEIKQTPLFKAQSKTEVTTQELVNVKIATDQELKNPKQNPKQKTNETLKMLLQGEKAVKKESGFTADFSVATARVIAPEAPQKLQQAVQSLESLLKGETEEKSSSTTATTTKLDGTTINKADSLDVKMNEAKQMTKYLSADVKNAIEDYKSPFTRIKVALNPQNLGSVELTVVQRGKNIHVNLSSNNAAINALAMNATDLKAQLQNNGINNATLNFNNNSQTAEQSFSGQQQQQQNAHQEQNAHRAYSYVEGEETHEEQMSSLEIVVPNYA